MSQITVENIKRSTETAARSTRGVAAAWVNFNGTGTIAARDSENVSSLTDNGSGTYTVSLTSAFDVADYASIFGGNGFHTATFSAATGSFNLYKYDATHTSADADQCYASCDGDLA